MGTVDITIFVAGFSSGCIFAWIIAWFITASRTSSSVDAWKPGQAVFISPQVEQLALEPNRKIAAIKLLRQENPGIGLAEAKQQVEDFQRRRELIAGKSPNSQNLSDPYTEQPFTTPAGVVVPIEVRQLIQNPGRKIEAIKLLREANPGMGLAEAKVFVEEMERKR